MHCSKNMEQYSSAVFITTKSAFVWYWLRYLLLKWEPISHISVFDRARPNDTNSFTYFTASAQAVDMFITAS